MSIPAAYPAIEAAKKAGWATRRHQDFDLHLKARRLREMEYDDMMLGAEERTHAATNRTPHDQMVRLNQRLGIGVGAARERARLAAKLSS